MRSVSALASIKNCDKTQGASKNSGKIGEKDMYAEWQYVFILMHYCVR